MIIINFKAYKEASGVNAVKLAEICDKVAKKYNADIAVAPQYADINQIKSMTDVQVFSQHIDALERSGAYTGHAVAENLKEAGISGTLINHSEHRLEKEKIKKCIAIAKNLGLISVCCAATPEEAGEFAAFGPDYIAIEPPELIGTGVSVSTAQPEIVTKSVDAVRNTNSSVKVLCGAGITTGDDVKKAIALGTVGVILASGFVKSSDPEKTLADFCENMKH